jgi:hypothetical protein
MNNKQILEKLVKIAGAQQKMLVKLAQVAQPTDDILSKASSYIKALTATWLTSNEYQVKYNYSLQESSDPNFNYEVTLVVTPAAGFNPPADFAQKYKDYIAGKLASNPVFKGLTFKIEVQINPAL